MKDDVNEDNDNGNYRRNNNKTTASKSFEYKTTIIESTSNNSRLNAEINVPLNYLSNFWSSFNFPMINCEINLVLRNCAVCEISSAEAVGEYNAAEETFTTEVFSNKKY